MTAKEYLEKNKNFEPLMFVTSVYPKDIAQLMEEYHNYKTNHNASDSNSDLDGIISESDYHEAQYKELCDQEYEEKSLIDDGMLKERTAVCDHNGYTIAWGPDANKCTKCNITWDV